MSNAEVASTSASPRLTLADCGLPLEVFAPGTDPLAPAQVDRLVWLLIALGAAARLVRYVLCFPLWEDECFLAINFIDRDFAGLLAPLDYHQVAPVLFLWVELALVRLWGFSEPVLRLVALASSLGSLLLLRHLARRLLAGTAQVLAVAIFAVAYPGIRYAAEVKPYGSDLLVALVLLALVVEWWRAPRQTRWLWLLAAFAPLAVGMSYPAAFVGGAVSLMVLAIAARRRQWSAAPAWVVYNTALCGAFGVAVFVGARHQADAELAWMADFWGNAFPPPVWKPLELAQWIVVAHSSDLLAYPVGGGRGASSLTLLCCLAAILVCWRMRRRWLLALCLAPLGLNLVAAALHRYPYGGHVKLVHYAAGVISILAGTGLAALLANHQRRNPRDRLLLRGVLAGLALIAVVSIVRDFAHPYKTLTDQRARDFARWFWFSMPLEGEVACVHTDFAQDFSPDADRVLNWTAMYLCNQHIYSPRRREGAALELDKVTADWPLRCVRFRSPLVEQDDAALATWLQDMQASYRLVSREEFAFPCYDKRERRLLNLDHLEVYKFVPRSDVARTPSPAAAALSR